MTRLEPIVLERRPNLVGLGDVNSTVAAALVCSELLIQVVGQVEAGRRSFERTMPEEINRPLSDHLADLLFRRSEDGDENLEREGVPARKVHRVGERGTSSAYSTVTDLARFRGWSTSQPRRTAM
jgi:UDP-N-acetylglucosamine 2-epimerase (non-hydrolysing)